MNYRFILHQLGYLLLLLAGAMMVPIVYELATISWRSEVEWPTAKALLISVGLNAVLGLVLVLVGRRGEMSRLGRREALLLVSGCWVLGGVMAALPFWFWAMIAQPHGDHPFHHFISCYFESVSGLTTTGSSVLSDFTDFPRGLLLWRALTHWLGGLGIVVLFVAMLPALGMGGKRLFHTESPGPKAQGLRPRIAETARVLWIIYLGLTVVQTVLLRLAGMGWFDAVCHTFATLATGGFGNYGASIGHFDSWVIDMIIFVFMVIAGINFGVYYDIVRGRWRQALHDPQMRVYLWMLGVSIVIIALFLVDTTITLTTGEHRELGLLGAFRYSAFQVGSIHSDCGFATADYDRWAFLPKAILMLGMFFGGCAGSTSGGLKISRVIVLAKMVAVDIERVFRPNVVRSVRVGRGVLDDGERQSVLMYTLLMLTVLGLGTILVRTLEGDGAVSLVEAGTAVLASFCNCGPALGVLGPVGHYGVLSLPTQGLLTLIMILGRLEIYALAALVLRRFWTGK